MNTATRTIEDLTVTIEYEDVPDAIRYTATCGETVKRGSTTIYPTDGLQRQHIVDLHERFMDGLAQTTARAEKARILKASLFDSH